ncbi:oligoendopeptidase F [Sporosarcina sp. P12(2017)]|uniref:M3 family oligoendopeptidase n=1 Tax=unclassified Sporosarcina TaxID=2647733 RepID=UPI000C16479D|nr:MULTISPECIES: M3 family oligoendopeptidase [unclassified Sporosarcina]PIC58560.1 oligoendopeptidase F [Sporosarcina sp. P10]PIC61879.1 oligoendopeptidase F [Sporosarcina sp. P12(2017)]
MLTFEDYEYTRPDIEKLKIEFQNALDQFKQANSFEEQAKIIEHINMLTSDYSTAENIMYIRSSIDTNDTFYQDERDYFDEIGPQFQALQSNYYQAVITTPFRAQLEDRWGSQLFKLAENAVQSYSDEVLPLLQQENKLISEYAHLVASAQIEFQGEMLTLAQLGPFKESLNRSVRKDAMNATADFFASHEDDFDRIFDRLVAVRHEIATTLGFKSFIELGYIRMDRIGYDALMMGNFRNQIRTHVVPLAEKIRGMQSRRIGISQMKFYDEPLHYAEGNPQPKGSPEWILENGQKMYQELSRETGRFFDYMKRKNLLDLVAKKGKEAGGYCTFIDNYDSPFIFSNFNGTSSDIDVLTHEAGHAFQVYSSRSIGIPEYIWPTTEAAEIHSMSMEFFTWFWMDHFFGSDAERYRYAHLLESVLFLPYGVAVDEFQQRIYDQPEMSPSERKAVWKELENIYLPNRDYDGHPYLEQGGFWQRQGHIYEVPFYYIDYALAQICALQFWQRSLNDFDDAWTDYLALCQLGGSKSFLELVATVHLRSPFEDGTVESIMDFISEWLVDHKIF